MKILVSACVLGQKCKYNGESNRNDRVIEFLKGRDYVSVCPELLAGLPTPRACTEIVGDRILDSGGEDYTAIYEKAVELALKAIGDEEIELAILQSRSPSCGVNQIYDGSFSGRLIPGSGVFARALMKRGIRVVDAEDI